jgi:hypothetical protein
MTGAGFATAEKSSSLGFAQANGYEFRGGIGVSAFAAGSGSGTATAIARSSAGLSDSFRVRDTSGLFNLSDTVFVLDIPIRATGSVSSSGAAFPPNPAFFSVAGAFYDYAWTLGQFSGSGAANSGRGSRGEVFETSSGSPVELVSLLVRSGELVNLSFSANALANVTAFPGAPASATADFGHTLRWGGVTGITARDGSGNTIDLPDGFALSMSSDMSGFDYWNAAGPNPFTTTGGVPEPASWAMMLLGFFGMGGVVRSRRRAVPA